MKGARQPGLLAKAEAESGKMGGPNQYALGDHGILIWTEGAYPGGVYHFTGEGNLQKLTTPKGGTIRNLDNANDKFHAIIEIGQGQSRFDLGLVGSNWRNFDFRHESRLGVTTIYDPDYLAMLVALDPGFVRVMDFMGANDNETTSFEERPQWADMTWRKPCVEACMELCVEIGDITGEQPDLWVNPPVLWNEPDFRKLAELIKAYIRFEARVYGEYSNEVWNGQFEQYGQNHDLAINDPQYADETNIFYRGRARYAHMSGLLAKAFNEILGRDRVRGVLCGHVADPSKHGVGLRWLKRNKPELLTELWGLGMAPYFGNSPMMARNDLTVDDFFDKPYEYEKKGVITRGEHYMMDRADSTKGFDAEGKVLGHTGQCIADAYEYKLVPCMYEYGKDFGADILMEPDPNKPGSMRQVKVNGKIVTPSQDVKIVASKDVRMRPAIRKNHENWFESGGQQCAYFVGTASQYGRFTWGATWGILELQAPIFLELCDLTREFVEQEDVKMPKIDAFGIINGKQIPLNDNVDLEGKGTIEFTCDVQVTSFKLQVYKGDKVEGTPVHAIVEKQKPYRLFGDDGIWNLGNGKFTILAIAYKADAELSRLAFHLEVGEDELERLRLQVNDLMHENGTLKSQLQDMQGQIELLDRELDSAKTKLNIIRETVGS
jgi:hypothetical protein